jgi:vesicular inhibitory amino acid transporter
MAGDEEENVGLDDKLNLDKPFPEVGELDSKDSLPRESEFASSKSSITEEINYKHMKQANCGDVRILFNIVNVSMGVSILTLPYTMRCSGWIFGLLILVAFTLIANYTARLVGRILKEYPDIINYVDIGEKAFGNVGKIIIMIEMVLELFSICVAFLILIGDNCINLFGPSSLRPEFYIMIGFAIILPTTWLKNMKQFSYLSVVGAFSIFFLTFILLFQGFYRNTSPGSLTHPMETLKLPETFMSLPISLGLIMSALVAHSIFASFYRQMKHPEHFSRVLNIAYAIIFSVYLIVSVAGYLMYGRIVHGEILKNLSEQSQTETVEALNVLTKIGIILLIINPICRYALELHPIGLIWEQKFLKKWIKKKNYTKRSYEILRILSRTLLGLLSLLCAIFIPSFLKVLGFIGAFFSFFGSILFPSACYLKLFRKRLIFLEKLFNWILVFFSILVMIVGPIWVALPSSLTNTEDLS